MGATKMRSRHGREEMFEGDADFDENLVGDGALKEFSERIAEGKNFSEVLGGEIRAGNLGVGALPANLYDANDSVARENRGADDFLDEFGVFGRQFDAFENSGMFYGGGIVDDFGPALPSGARGERRFAGKRDEADGFQRLGHDQMAMPPAMLVAEDRHFVSTDG